MNRVQPLQPPPSTAQCLCPPLANVARVTSTLDHGHQTFFVPLHYETNYAYPLIVWLHSPGGDENELKQIMPWVSQRNYVAVCPRGTLAAHHYHPSARGATWSQNDDHIILAQERIIKSVRDAQRRFHVAPSRIFIAGYQSGGTMAFRTAMNFPEIFAGALSIGGPFPTGNTPLRRYPLVRRVPLFLATGLESKKFLPKQFCDNLRLFHAAALTVTVRQYRCGDELRTAMLSDMDRWIMDQIASPSQVPAI